MLFTADDGVNGNDLWRTDGTPAGTMLVKDICPVGPSNPTSLVNVNGTLFFAAANCFSSGQQLFKSDGTSEGSALVKDALTERVLRVEVADHLVAGVVGFDRRRHL